MSTGGGGSTTNTNTQVQEIPEFEQQSSLNNQALAASLGAQPYPTYQADLTQGFTPLQTQGQQQAVNAATAYQPGLNQATGVEQGALNPSAVYGLSGAAAGSAGQAQSLTNPNAIGAYMNPFVSQALAPQIQDLQLQQAQQQLGINQTATQDAAFGDARQGSAQALQNLYGNQALSQLIGTGYNNAYTQAQSALGQAENTNLGAASQYGNLANIAGTEQQTQLTGGNDLAALAAQQQALGITGANATYNAGQQQQQLGQTELNTAYQQFLNQVNWPYQMLNVQESALSNSPYTIATATQLPSLNTVGQGLGSLGSLAGILGGLGSGGSGGGTTPSVFGAA